VRATDLFYDMGRYGEAEQQYLLVARRKSLQINK
jgi:hypothetical protein